MLFALRVAGVFPRIFPFTVRLAKDADVALIARVFFGDLVTELLFCDGASRLLAERLEVFIFFPFSCVNEPFAHGYPAGRGQVELLERRLTNLARFSLCPLLAGHVNTDFYPSHRNVQRKRNPLSSGRIIRSVLAGL